MCQSAPSPYSTIVGSNRAVNQLIEHWKEFRAPVEAEIGAPIVANLTVLDSDFADEGAPAVARIDHVGCPPGIMGMLQAEIALKNIGVIVESGYSLSLSAIGKDKKASLPHVELNQVAVDAIDFGPLPPTAGGARVAVLDTGYLGDATKQMVDFLRGQPQRRRSSDDHGHGTAVSELIGAVAAPRGVQVAINPIRVVRASLTSSYEMLCGLAYATYSGAFDIVNVSLSIDLPAGCPTMLGTSMAFLVEKTRVMGRPLPTLVTAAGNSTSNHRFSYPARLPTAVVVAAWDSSGRPAQYNVDLPQEVQPCWASGGDDDVPFASVQRNGHTASLFGTSFAAAVVTGRLVR
jgi:Subtilase family